MSNHLRSLIIVWNQESQQYYRLVKRSDDTYELIPLETKEVNRFLRDYRFSYEVDVNPDAIVYFSTPKPNIRQEIQREVIASTDYVVADFYFMPTLTEILGDPWNVPCRINWPFEVE